MTHQVRHALSAATRRKLQFFALLRKPDKVKCKLPFQKPHFSLYEKTNLVYNIAYTKGREVLMDGLLALRHADSGKPGVL